MAIIYSYPQGTPTLGDNVIGSQIDPITEENKTVQFTVGQIAGFANSYSLGYTVYSASLVASAGAAPTATILQNTTGLTFTWTRTGPGVFVATVAGTPFATNKFWAMSSAKVPQLTSIVRTSTNTARLDNVTSSTGAALNDLVEAYVEIRVYA
tara:strand:+ start:25 stop:483 length:459 start_codon:yes stop_codon:yes gene_type:complete